MLKLLRILILQKDSHAFWLSFVLCLSACCFILFVIAPLTGLSQSFGSGNDGYIQLARSLVAGDGYVFNAGGPKVFHRPPLYPILLTSVAIFPQWMQRYVIILPQSLMVGITGLLIFKIARKVFSPVAARVSILIFLLNPWLYWNAKNPMTAILQMTLYISFVYLFAKLCQTLSNPETAKKTIVLQVIYASVIAAALSLTHAAMLPVAGIGFLALLVIGVIKKSARTTKASIASLLILIAALAPWTYRNYVAFHRFIPVSGGGGLAYFNGNVHWKGIEPQPQKKGETYIDASLRTIGITGTEKTQTHWKGFKSIENEEIANRKMVEDIKTHPLLFVKKVGLNAVEYYFPAFTYPFLAVKRLSAEQIGLTVFYLLLWIVAFAAPIIRANEPKKPFLLGIAVILIYSMWYFPFATFIGHSLYTLGTVPFLSILAGTGACSIFALFHRPS